ncbi:MAG TPA: hypothetical protein PKJ45_02050 [Rubrivivax sp.]|nr:hypothetical protein [Rubrivivax sp.]
MAFQIGWDHAQHGLVPPAALLDGSAVGQGWRAGRAVFGARVAASTRALRQWLALRLQAWRLGAPLDPARLTPGTLARLDTPYCPVTRQPLGGSEALAPVPMRLCEERPFTAENLVVVSRTVAKARAGLTAAQILQRAERMQREDASAQAGLDAAAWARLASLTSLATELPGAQAARVPLRVLPPAHVQVCNPVQALQAALTQGLRLPGWSRRAAAIAGQLPRTALRHDFNLFVGALAARLMEIDPEAAERELRWALEDAWADRRVQRRWAQFGVLLDNNECEDLLAQVQDCCGRPMLPRRHERAARPLRAGPLRSPDSRPCVRARQTRGPSLRAAS